MVKKGLWLLFSKKSILATACLAWFLPAAQAACQLNKKASISVTIRNNRIIVPVAVNGSFTEFALDTGAGITSIASATANELNIPHDFDHSTFLGGVGGASSVLYIGQIETLALGGLQFSHRAYPIIDMPPQAFGGQLAGLLGADILRQFDIDLDLSAGRMDFYQAAACIESPAPWQNPAAPVSIELDSNGHILLAFRANGANLTGMLDTGAPALSLTTRAAYRAGVDDSALDEDRDVQGTGVNNRSWRGHIHRFETIEFAGLKRAQVFAAVIPNTAMDRNDALGGADALLGLSLFNGSRLWISYSTKTLVMRGGG